MYNIGDAVWWISLAQGFKIERAGYIVSLVPAGHDPQQYAPEGTYCKHYGPPRTHDTYLVRVPDVQYLFWPQIAALNIMTEDKEYILTSQPKSIKHYRLRTIDRSDREKIKALAKRMGDEYTETKEMIEVKAWKTRFWFAIAQWEEYIKTIDRG